MKDRIKDYFAFTKKEQRGMTVLLGLLFLSITINALLPSLVPEKQYDISPFKAKIEAFLKDSTFVRETDRSRPFHPESGHDINYDTVLEAFLDSSFYFDPNEMEEKNWLAMGMPENIVRNILRYREKGGVFRDKEGFRKIYGMNDEIFGRLNPYLLFSDADSPLKRDKNTSWNKEKTTNYRDSGYPQKEQVLIELNASDSSALLALNGIGPSFAGKIIRYRDRLGGFYRAEQLLEIRGMDSARYSQLSSQIIIDSNLISKIDLNAVTFKDLLRHPYFEYYLVKEIFMKRDDIKRFDSVEQLKDIEVMYLELYNKIRPYLKVE